MVRWVAVLAVLIGLVSGCAQPPKPPQPLGTDAESINNAEASRTWTTSPTPTPTVSPVAPTLPPQATGADAAGAQAFVGYWVATLNYAIASGDTMLLENASTPECTSCRSYVQVIREIYDGGGHIEGNAFHMDEPTTVDLTDSVANVQVLFSHDSGAEYRGAADIRPVAADDPATRYAVVVFKDGRWQFFGLATP